LVGKLDAESGKELALEVKVWRWKNDSHRITLAGNCRNNLIEGVLDDLKNGKSEGNKKCNFSLSKIV
jgi:hypothetical protein